MPLHLECLPVVEIAREIDLFCGPDGGWGSENASKDCKVRSRGELIRNMVKIAGETFCLLVHGPHFGVADREHNKAARVLAQQRLLLDFLAREMVAARKDLWSQCDALLIGDRNSRCRHGEPHLLLDIA